MEGALEARALAARLAAPETVLPHSAAGPAVGRGPAPPAAGERQAHGMPMPMGPVVYRTGEGAGTRDKLMHVFELGILGMLLEQYSYGL